MKTELRQENIRTFEQAVAYLYCMPRFTTKHSIQETRNHLNVLGDPDRFLHIIHVAGTNGKGSVCAYLRSILEAAGKKVAMFTSPHLTDIRERFVIDGRMVTKEVFLEAFLAVYHSLDWKALEQGQGYHPTFFEYLFFMAMLIFAEEKHSIDYCILETGVGGRLDATNSVFQKELTVITGIGLDHTEYLGGTIREIAEEKAGILSEGVPFVFSDTRPEASEVFFRQAGNLRIPTYPVSKKDYTILNFKNKSIDFLLQSRYYGYIRLTINTIAAYQTENAALAVRAVEVLDQHHFVTQKMLQDGLARCFWPGRMEEVLPEVYVDGAHNEDGIRAFLETVKMDGFDGKRKLLFSAVADKDYEKMIALVAAGGLFSRFAIVQMQTSRALSLENMDKIMRRYPECAYTLYGDTGMALYELLTGRKEDERIYIAGSLYLVGEVKCLAASKKLTS